MGKEPTGLHRRAWDILPQTRGGGAGAPAREQENEAGRQPPAHGPFPQAGSSVEADSTLGSEHTW